MFELWSPASRAGLLLQIALACAAASLTHHAYAADPVIKSPVMEIAPWGIITNGDPGGIYYEIQDALARRAGFSPQLRIRPYVRVAKEIGQGDGDFTLMTDNPEIAVAANKVGLLIDLDVIVLSKADAHISSLQALNGKRVAILHGTDHHHMLDGKAQVTVNAVKSSNQQLQMLATDRVDAILGVRQAVYFDLKHMAASDKKPKIGEALVVGKVQAFIWLGKKSPQDWGPKLKAASDALRTEGKLDEIFKRYQ